jgi:hypothetical protein
MATPSVARPKTEHGQLPMTPQMTPATLSALNTPTPAQTHIAHQMQQQQLHTPTQLHHDQSMRVAPMGTPMSIHMQQQPPPLPPTSQPRDMRLGVVDGMANMI